jgi:hypothetical protein
LLDATNRSLVASMDAVTAQIVTCKHEQEEAERRLRQAAAAREASADMALRTVDEVHAVCEGERTLDGE